MRKFLKTKNLTNLKVMITAAVFAAISIVCGKFLAFPIGETMRFSLENLPIILSGALYGPVVAAVTGLVADLVGCILRGYAINPIITAASVFIGFAAGAVFSIMKSSSIHIKLALAVIICHLIGSVIIKTVGLSVMLSYPFLPTLIGRIINYIIVAAAEFILLEALFRNKSFLKTMGSKDEL